MWSLIKMIKCLFLQKTANWFLAPGHFMAGKSIHGPFITGKFIAVSCSLQSAFLFSGNFEATKVGYEKGIAMNTPVMNCLGMNCHSANFNLESTPPGPISRPWNITADACPSLRCEWTFRRLQLTAACWPSFALATLRARLPKNSGQARTPARTTTPGFPAIWKVIIMQTGVLNRPKSRFQVFYLYIGPVW